ncbi:MAG: hypothetical protein J3K34DRAFT_421418 [Monoraphidium minutum]|nr:MAG: hypothetical protein J3K34DRAFT_421418 [Monoraphidium minutum]
MEPRHALLLALVACHAAAGASAALPVPVRHAKSNATARANATAFNWDDVLTAKHVPLVKLPSLAPSILEALGFEGVRGGDKQNATNNPALLKLSTLMPRLPSIPTFDVPTFGPATTDAEVAGNVSLAASALRVPLVESTALPGYVAGLKARVASEAAWLAGFLNDTAAQGAACALLPQYAARCVALTGSMQRAKVQALEASLGVLESMEGQLNGDLAAKLAAFDRPSPKALNGNWLCNVAAALDAAIKDSASRAAKGATAAKATAGVAKLSEFVSGRAEGSALWRLQAGAQLPKVAAACPLAV